MVTMALLNPTFIFGIIVTLYLFSFVLFAIIRVITGLSIQRIGYLSLRRLAYTPRDGCRVEVRGLGFSIHRPTFAQPTWLSVVLNELVVTIDVRELERHKATELDPDEPSLHNDEKARTTDPSVKVPKTRQPPRRAGTAPPRSETWKRLKKIKDRIKRLHRNVKWLRMVDLVATNSTINVVDVGQIQVGSFTIAVDTRRKTVDRARFFFQRSHNRKEERQAEWIVTVRSVLFTAYGQESLEVLDYALLNIHGFLYESREGLRDATVALKLGRVHIPYDDIQVCARRYKHHRHDSSIMTVEEPAVDFVEPNTQNPQGTDEMGATSDDLIRTLSDSKELVASVLRGIKEVQFAVSFVGLTKKIESIQPSAAPLQINASMKEVGIDLHRLDPKSPAHRMYFPSKDIAHEALVAALSISVGLDDGHGSTDSPERLLYVPMATTTVRTTLPSKTVELPRDKSVEERNTNIVWSNTVITSPSVDLDPRHLPILIALMQPTARPSRPNQDKRRFLIPRLLPRTISKVTMHEPVIRIKLKPLDKTEVADDFDLIISSISSISMDMESSHSFVENSHYTLNGALRLQSHHLYYQTNSRERFDLITTDSFDMKLHLTASPDVSVDLSGNVSSFSISMTRPEITDGLRQIVRELRLDVEAEKKRPSKAVKNRNFLRSMPSWLSRIQIEATDLNVEIAGVDEDISDDTRGVSIHWDALSGEYREHKMEGLMRIPRTRAHSRSINTSDSEMTPSAQSPRPRRQMQNVGDGRRLVVNARGMEAHIMESVEKLESEPFLDIPRFELAFSASSDGHGPMFHVQSSIRTVRMHYSLYRHYSIGVATMTLRKAFMKTGQDGPQPRHVGTTGGSDFLVPPATPGGLEDPDVFSTVTPEVVLVDVKASLVQIKAEMPHEPLMMLHIYGLECGRHRWSTPYMLSKLIRLYVEPPRMHGIWARIISIKAGRLDLRELKRKTINGVVEEKMVDVSSEAIRVGIPHEVIISRITDNCVNVIKAVQQLHHRFKTGTNEYILEKHPEGPKNVPKISVRARSFLFELEDGAFEWKLGLIYRTGRVEQVQRIARQEAFKAKIARVRDEEARRGASNKGRSRSAYQRGRTDQAAPAWFRSRSLDALSPTDSGPGPTRGRIPRYDPETETIGISGHAKVSEMEAERHLDVFNAQTWKRRIDRAYEVSQTCVRQLRSQFWGSNELPDEVEETETILEVPHRPALMSTMINDLHIVIDKPTFPMSELPDFLHKVGKGMPKDMIYSLLIPMHVSIEMDEARVTLRDYPLPLFHIPALKTGQSGRLTAVSLKTNFVIAEEFRGAESARRVRVNIIPAKSADHEMPNKGSFAIEVRRTIGPVKSFSDVYVDINTALPTKITWGPCYQPAVQDMMMVVESFTKPQIDPSARVGFWDKLRLVFHSRIHVAWKGDGDMHLALKGTRDPYNITGPGAGFLMCWRNDVRWNINAEDDPKRFMTVDSGEYILAVPDFSHQIREVSRRQEGEGPLLMTEDTSRPGAVFKKVVMKLSGKVQWMAGLVFERAIVDGKRSFDFKPHYKVVLKNPQYAKPVDGEPFDSMQGFRSRHIHLSIAVRAPVDRDWMAENSDPSRSYNTVHLTPRFFTHFFSWWALFGGPISLPIRQGNLFPGREKNSKKFGRHLATVKYSLLLAPLFLSHIYKHKDAEDYSENAVSATGLKVRFDSFMLDLHQRREEFNTLGKGKSAQSRTSGVKIHAAQLDLASADLRAVSASLKGTTTEAIKKGSISTLVTDQDDTPNLSRFTIPDHDYAWIDMDDFVELDWILPTEPHPHTKILPLAYAPRLTYVRQTDVGGTISGDPSRTSPFGEEPTHFCIMSHDDDPRGVQAKLIKDRLHQLMGQMTTHTRNVGEAELKVIKTNSKDPDTVSEFEALRKHTSVLQEKKAFLENMLKQLQAMLPTGDEAKKKDVHPDTSEESIDVQDETLHIPSTAEFESDFSNRFMLHNMQLKWNNVLRNIVLRYIHQNSQRRGFIYYLSRPAIKFILDIVEEQNKTKAAAFQSAGPSMAANRNQSPGPSIHRNDTEKSQKLEDRIKNILGDGAKFHSASFGTNADGNIDGTIADISSGISTEFTTQMSYHVRLIAPQIQMQSEKNKKHVVLVTAKNMELKVMEVMDKERISDSVSGLVQRRFLVNMDSAQFFVTHHKWFMTNLVSMYAASRYGAQRRGSSWPPWVPLEVMFDFQAAPFGFKRVVQKTSAMVRYDKYNTLRLKYNDEVNTLDNNEDEPADPSERRTDHLWVEFPQARALCNSSQYYAMYVIVLDLLMYSEPLEKRRNERLEKIMLASDFSDLSGAPERIQQLQERIRQLEEIKFHFQVYSKYLDMRGWQDRLSLERDLAHCEDELFFVMKAITTSQRQYDARDASSAMLKWNISLRDIVWHLMQDSNEPLVELQLKELKYDRTDHSDGSHMNLVQVGRILGLNLLPDATYPEIIAPYQDGEKVPGLEKSPSHMVQVYWHLLEAIAGISVMDKFQLELFPMKIQLEHEVGKRILEYVFPGMNGGKMSTSKTEAHSLFKHNLAQEPEPEPEPELDTASVNSSTSRLGSPNMDSSGFSTRAGSLEIRLRPTLTSYTPERTQKKSLHVNTGEGHGFRLFRGGASKAVAKKSSLDSLRALNQIKPISRSGTAMSKDSLTTATSESKKRFGLRKPGDDKSRESDDLTKMIARASNYMSFAYIHMPSVVLCLSYKGKDQRNVEDVHDFVFRLPAVEWRNKTWSNMDLVLALKKQVVKALISHTGAIIGNKFYKHRPNAEQRTKLRELATSSALIAPSSSAGSHYAGSVNDSDDSSSLYDHSPVDYSRSPPRSLRGSTHGSILPPRSTSRSSSVASSRSLRKNSGIPIPTSLLMTMTPPTPTDGPSEGSSSQRGFEMLRAGTDGLRNGRSMGSASSDNRPSTSGSLGDRRKSAGNGLRDKISAFTHRRIGHQTSGLGEDLPVAEDDDEETKPNLKSSPSKKMSWTRRS